MWSSGRESVTRRIRRVASSVVLAIALLAGERSAEARITRVVFTTVQSPTFGGTSFDAVGPYEKLAGRAPAGGCGGVDDGRRGCRRAIETGATALAVVRRTFT